VAVVVGYARVSTNQQQLLGQTEVLTAAGVGWVFTDQVAGVREDRPGLVALLDDAWAGERAVALDWLGRSLSGRTRTIETWTEGGVLLRSLREGIDYSTAAGRMLAGIFAALAADERELLCEWAAAARAGGRNIGWPLKLSAAHGRQVGALRGPGESVSELVRSCGVSRATLYRAISARELAEATAEAAGRATLGVGGGG